LDWHPTSSSGFQNPGSGSKNPDLISQFSKNKCLIFKSNPEKIARKAEALRHHSTYLPISEGC
jgi:hypothetical protein